MKKTKKYVMEQFAPTFESKSKVTTKVAMSSKEKLNELRKQLKK